MLKQYLAELEDIKIRKAQLKDEETSVNEKIDALVSEQVEQARIMQGKDLGAVTVLIDGVDVKHTIQKKVVWDQEELLNIFWKILKHKDQPSNYMKMKFSVGEKEYSKFIPEVQQMFMAARTVEAGAAKYDFKVRA